MYLIDMFNKKLKLPTAETALAGRDAPIPTSETHFVNGRALAGPYEQGLETVIFGLGCFWGAERKFWQLPRGVWVTAVGYAGGYTENPTYQETCGGMTGHTEAVLVVYDPKIISFTDLLKTFWESHDPTQGMRQGNDVGTQYRSAIYATTDEQLAEAEASAKVYGDALKTRGFGPVTTEIRKDVPFYFAEAYHQQYLAKNPAGYCGLGGTGVSCAIGTGVSAA
jgi:peptide-methionine (S)-S-oxide reductase